MTPHDLNFDAINSAALRGYPGVLYRWFPNGVLHGDEYTALNPLRDDRSRGSFRINTRTGKWADFAETQRGNTPITLYAEFYCDGNHREAAEHLAGQMGMLENVAPDPCITELLESLKRSPKKEDVSEAGWTLIPVEDDAPPPPLPPGCPAWVYHNINGRVLGYVARVATANGGKKFTPITRWQNDQGIRAWRFKQFPRPLPIYNRLALQEFPDWPVLIVEGEKTADAGQAQFAGMVVVTWPQGSSSAAYADWALLAGRTVLLLADHDEPGRKAMRTIAEKLAEIATVVWRLDVEESRPVGWDVADGTWANIAEAMTWLESLPRTELSRCAVSGKKEVPQTPMDERTDAALDKANGKGPVYEAVPEKAIFEPFPVPPLQAMAEWIDSQVGIAHPLATQSITLALASVAMGRRYKSPHGGQGGLSFGLVSDTTQELADYMDVAYRIMDAAGLRRLVRMTRFASDTQLYQALEKAPAQMYLSADYGAAVALTKKQTSGSTDNLLAAITAVSRGKTIQLDRSQVADPKAVIDDNPVLYEPALTLVAWLAFDSLTALWRSGEYGRGAVESFSYAFAYAEDQEIRGASREDPIPDWLLKNLQLMRGVPPIAEGSTHPLSVIFPNSSGLFPAEAIPVVSHVSELAYNQLLKPLDDLMQDNMDVRPVILAARRRIGFIATLMAVFGGTAVTADLVSYAVRYELQRFEGFRRQKHQAKQDKEQGVYEQLLAVISKKRHHGMRFSDLPAASWGYRRMNEEDRVKLLQKMKDDGVIVQIEPKLTGKAGRHPVAVIVAKAYSRQVNS